MAELLVVGPLVGDRHAERVADQRLIPGAVDQRLRPDDATLIDGDDEPGQITRRGVEAGGGAFRVAAPFAGDDLAAVVVTGGRWAAVCRRDEREGRPVHSRRSQDVGLHPRTETGAALLFEQPLHEREALARVGGYRPRVVHELHGVRVHIHARAARRAVEHFHGRRHVHARHILVAAEAAACIVVGEVAAAASAGSSRYGR